MWIRYVFGVGCGLGCRLGVECRGGARSISFLWSNHLQTALQTVVFIVLRVVTVTVTVAVKQIGVIVEDTVHC